MKMHPSVKPATVVQKKYSNDKIVRKVLFPFTMPYYSNASILLLALVLDGWLDGCCGWLDGTEEDWLDGTDDG